MEEKDFFITTWRTSTANETITIPTTGAGYNYNVSWGDGKDETGFTGDAMHQYEKAGVYTVKISGEFPTIYFNERKEEEKTKILTIEQWGTIQWKSFFFSFDGCSNLTLTATDAPDLSKVTDMSGMFSGASLFNGDLNHWDVSSITSLVSTFSLATSFNGNINEWNVANVESMSAMFSKASSFEGDLSSWNVGNVSNMSSMFSEAYKFNSDISGWDVKNVTDMSLMFFDARAFNRNIGGWNVGKVKNMLAMFQEAKLYTENYDALLIGWNRQELQSNVPFSGGSSAYCLGEEARENIISKFNWAITDGNKDEQCGAVDVNKSLIKASPTNVAADGVSSSTIEVQLLDINGVRITSGGDKVVIVSSLGNLGDVIDNSDGTYTVGLTSNVEGTAELSFTVNGVASMNKTNVSFVEDSESFITTWETTTDNEYIAIPITGVGYEYDVFWGDGSEDIGVTRAIAHEYSKAGIYKVKIKGRFPRIYFNNKGYKEKILSVDQWGSIEWFTMDRAFTGCSNLTMKALDSPDLSKVNSLHRMFQDAKKVTGDFSNWDVSNIRDMSFMFFKAENFNSDLSDWKDKLEKVDNMASMFSLATSFNGDISKWNVSNVSNMSKMFSGATSFNQNLNSWDVSNVRDMSGMFASTDKFNSDLNTWKDKLSNVENMASMFFRTLSFEGNIKGWDVSNVKDMSFMFSNSVFNGDISDWKLLNITNMRDMFSGADKFNADISKWNVSNVENMAYMFDRATSFNQNLNDWNVGNVRDMFRMFHEASNFDQDLNKWRPSMVTNMSEMFSKATLFNQDLSDWDVSSVEDMSKMFYQANSFNGNLSNWDVSNVKDMSEMFHEAIKFNGDVVKWKPSKVTNMSAMFLKAADFDKNINEWDVGSVENMSRIFEEAISFNSDLDKWNTVNVTTMFSAFKNAKLFNGNLSGWDVSNVETMYFMFYQAYAFQGFGLDQWKDKLGKVKTMQAMFSSATKFSSDISDWDVSNVENMRSMFSLAWAFKADISKWNVVNVTTMSNMFNQIYVENYDNVLISWSKLNLKRGVTLHAGRSTYCEGAEARKYIDEDLGWRIYDYGEICPELDINKSTIIAIPTIVEANNTAFSTITVQLLDTSGAKITSGGEIVVIKTTLGNLSNVTDNLNGTYTATLSSEVEGNAELSFSVNGEESINKTNVSFQKDTESFITTWQTTSDNESITIPTEGSGYDYTVDWGDGTVDSAIVGNATHVYAKGGIYTVKIKGDFPRIFFNNQGDKDKILTIEQWGVIKWESMNLAFSGCSKLISKAIDAPDLLLVTSMRNMFQKASLFNGDLSLWNTSNVKDMFGVFHEAESFNGDISTWNTVRVINMSYMFNGAKIFNQDLVTRENVWDVSSVTLMHNMFQNAESFNGDISTWNTVRVINMSYMFNGAKMFDQDLVTRENVWNVSSVTSMKAMFSGAETFNGDISTWNTSKVTDMSFMFNGAKVFAQDLITKGNIWNVSNVTNMLAMFQNAKKFNGDLNSWDVSSVTNMASMFSGASVFNQDIKWGEKVNNVINMLGMFSRASVFNGDISEWNVGNVLNMANMFQIADLFDRDLSNWDVSKVTNMHRMFRAASSFDQSLGNWNVSNVTDMSEMFKSAKLSTENYDASLIGWSKQNLQENVPFDGGNSNYCDGEKARGNIISKFKWTITDSGRDIACVQLDLTKSIITAVPQNININKEESSLITVQLKDEFGNDFTRPTELVSIASTKGVTSTIQNLGNGLYQTELRDDSVGTAIVSFKVGAEKGIQNTLVSFYQPLGCQVPFNIKADQTIRGAKGRYRRIYDEPIDATIPWITFEITNFSNPSTPLLREAAEYELEIMIQGVNGVWTDWYKHSSFVINGCEQNQENVLEIYKGNCFSVLGDKVKVYLKTGDTSKMYLYKDAGFNIPFKGNNESYVIVSKPSYSEYEKRSLVPVSTIEFKVREDGEMHGIVPCNSYDS